MKLSIMKFNKKRKVAIRSVFKQLLFVWLAFFLMIFISYLFVKNIVHNYLTQEAKNVLSYTQSKITTDLFGIETSLLNVSQSIRSMILRGDSAEAIQEYMTGITKYLTLNEAQVAGFNGIYGVFDAFNMYLDGTDWKPPEDYVPKERPWYKAAVAAGGGIAATTPYVDAQTGEIVVTYSRHIFDDNGNSLGVVCIDLLLDRIVKFVMGTHLAEGGYGILLSENLDIIAIPMKEIIGKSLAELPYEGIRDIVNDLKNGLDISERKIIDDNLDLELILFTKRLDNGWHIGILTPVEQYYQKIKTMRMFVAILGIFLASALSFVLIRLAVASKTKSDFLAKMSHEIRTPMNAIIGMSEVALRKNMPDDVREDIVTIKQAGTNLLSIINDLLDISKIESGKLEIIPINYMFSSLVNEIANIIKMRITNPELRLELNIDSNIPDALFGDEVRIRQVLLNVLSNAIKYTKKGFVSFSARGEITGDTVILIIDVSDSGIGIKKEDLAKLFNDFARLDSTANKYVEGVGLGLAITKNIVTAMGGDINVHSEYGKGSTFTIKLPQKIGSLEESRNSNIIKFNAPNAKILIVDDMDTNLKVAAGLMQPYKMQIDSRLSGQEAIEAVTENSYDIVFMDHMMPEMDGIEATKRIREMGYGELPIIALTANAVSGVKEMFLANGFNDFLSKPIDTAKLNAILEKWLPKEKQEEAEEIADNGESYVDAEILAAFHKSATDKINEIKKCLETENYSLYTIYVHALKGASAIIGALELSEMAKSLEKAGEQRDLAYIKQHNPEFLNALKNFLDNMDNR